MEENLPKPMCYLCGKREATTSLDIPICRECDEEHYKQALDEALKVDWNEQKEIFEIVEEEYSDG